MFVIADDLGAPYHGFPGADYVRTPDLYAVAESGGFTYWVDYRLGQLFRFLGWDADSGETALYHVVDDPRSDRDVSAETPDVVEKLKDRIDVWRAQYQR